MADERGLRAFDDDAPEVNPYTVIVRVWLPDRPGALGQVASRIGAVKGDVIGFDILERGGGRAVDELVVALPAVDVIELLIKEIDAVDGVSVEHVRPVESDRADPGLAALTLGAEVAEAPADTRLGVLLEGLVWATEADWAVAGRARQLIASCGELPEESWLLAFLDGSEHLDETNADLPSDILLARMTSSQVTIAAGRSGRRVHASERLRMSLLVRVADALV